MPVTHCPHLGLSEDPSLHLSYPDERHRCFASSAPVEIELQHQSRFCLAEQHPACPRYVTPPEPVRHKPRPLEAETEVAGEEGVPSGPWWRPFLWGTALLLLALVVWRYGSILMSSGHTSPASAPAIAGLSPTPDRAPSPAPTPLPVPDPTETPASPSVVPPTATPTPWPEGRIFTLQPSAGAVGWVASNETRGNHLGDSFMHSGYQDDVIFHGALQFDLFLIAPGTRLHAAALHLTGLTDLRLGEGGAWEVRLLSAAANEDWPRQTFQTLHDAVAEQTLLPVLGHDALAAGRDNVFAFTDEQLRLLEDRLLDGAISFRLDGPQTAPNDVFTWDSGYGPASRGQGPVLWISAGPPPLTPLPTPTIEYVVVASTPTPENVMTAAAVLQTATAQATMVGTATPLPPNVATPTPMIVVTSTPTPQNAATATALSAYATAVAMTTGTFTPTPPNVVTATPTPTIVVIIPTPTSENVMTPLAMAIAEATRAARQGTATPLPSNWAVGIVAGNAAAATAISAQATITALTWRGGQNTPTPVRVIMATPTPPTPLLIYLDELTPTPTSTPTPPLSSFAIPAVLQGKIAFLSDRGGQVAIYVMEPDGSRVALLTSRWPYDVALQREQLSPDGHERVFVENDGQGLPQLFIATSGQDTPRQLTAGESMSYDPAWSPRDDLIAFVSQEPGNDEIFVIQSDGQGRQRLTVNNWEWDKHPTWSPDGTRIAFWSNRETGRQQIWVMNADGSERRNISKNPYNDWDPVWIK